MEMNSESVGIRNKVGKGEVVWIPSLLGLGGRIENDYSGLARFLEKEAETSFENLPVRFQQRHQNMLMKTLQSGNSFITIIVNKDPNQQEIKLRFQNEDLTPRILYSDSVKSIQKNKLTLYPEETVVIAWK